MSMVPVARENTTWMMKKTSLGRQEQGFYALIRERKARDSLPGKYLSRMKAVICRDPLWEGRSVGKDSEIKNKQKGSRKIANKRIHDKKRFKIEFPVNTSHYILCVLV